jgi:ribosomal protein S18 acetylase RimI-like enzyme
MFRLQRVLRSIKLSATKSFQRVPKTIIPEIKLCRYASANTLAKCPLRSMPRLKGAYTVDITYRPARSEDLEDAERIVQVAGNELRLRHGRQPWPAPPPIAFPKFCLAEAPDGLWVAEHGGTIVGFGFSWMTETFWFLSQLFVKPETQAKGIGQALLSKALMQAERNRATNRALITPAYNTASTGLYLKNGFYPREPLYRMSAPAQSVAEKLADAGYDTTPIAPWPEPREWMAEIDGELLGFRRDMHHRFLLGGGAAHAVRIERDVRHRRLCLHLRRGPCRPTGGHSGRRCEGGRDDSAALCAGERAEPSLDDRSGTGRWGHASGIGARASPRRAIRPEGVAAFWQLVQLSGACPGFSVAVNKWRGKWKVEYPASSTSTPNSQN